MMLNCIVTVSVFVCVGAVNIKLIENVKQMDEKITVETHQVTTEDLYILTIFRLRNLKMNVRKNQYSVVMFHGIMQSSDRFIEHGRNLSLAYDLADAGFDVWLGNNRGNKYSRHHVYLNPDDPEDKFKFFNYTYEDIGVNDVAATVDYILNETKTKQLHYIGHSQGGTIFYVLNSMRPEYNEKFLTANLLAGAGYQKHFSNSLLEMLALVADNIYAILLKAGYVEVFSSESGFHLSSSYTVEDLVKHCLNTTRYQHFCAMLHSSKVLGTQGIDSSWFAGGGAVKELVHFGQNIRLKRFCRWDYGIRNEQVYGTKDPPNYDLGLITVNTTLHFGMGDNLVNYADVEDMANDMLNAQTRKVARADFGHSDFTDAFDAKELVYDYIIEALLYFETNIDLAIVEKKSPVYLSVINTPNSFNKNNSNSFTQSQLDSPITSISSFSFRIGSPNVSKSKVNISRSITRNKSKFLYVNNTNVIPRNASGSINSLLLTNISNSPQSLLNTSSKNSLHDDPFSSDSLTTEIPKSLHENYSGFMTSNDLNSSHANNFDSINSNGPNSSQIIPKNYLARNMSDVKDQNDFNVLPNRRFNRVIENTNVAHSSRRYLTPTAPASSTKNCINTTMLITAILILKIV